MNVMSKKLGRISSARFGRGGYDDAMLGVSLTFTFDKAGGVAEFKGTWRGVHAKRDEQLRVWGETVAWLDLILRDAKKDTIEDLVGTPVEITFDGNRMTSWRVLTEVIG